MLGDKMQKKMIEIEDDFITLGQLLKYEAIISSGGLAKWYLNEYEVLLNNTLENRRGKKLYPGDIVTLVDEQLEMTITRRNAD